MLEPVYEEIEILLWGSASQKTKEMFHNPFGKFRPSAAAASVMRPRIPPYAGGQLRL